MEFWGKNLYVCWFGAFATAISISQLAPFLPLYVEYLGVGNAAQVARWSGVVFGSTTLIMALFSPLWGHLADRLGRKKMLLRASLGQAIVIIWTGLVQDVYQLLLLRLLLGAVAGYNAAAITLVASQSPKEHSGWALGVLATASVGGVLLGPLVGGYLAETVGLRFVFFGMGGFLMVAFFTTLFFVREEFVPPKNRKELSFRENWRMSFEPGLLITMFVTIFVIHVALMSIEPIITVYIKELSIGSAHVPLISGMVFSASGLATILAAPRLGRLSDKIGPRSVILAALAVAAVLFIPQAFVRTSWQLGILRFLLGIATAGLLPAIHSVIRRSIPGTATGRAFGVADASRNLGTFAGAVFGGQVAGAFGFRCLFFTTATLLFLNLVWIYKASGRVPN